MIYKTLHRKLKIEQQEPYKNPGMNSGAITKNNIAGTSNIKLPITTMN
jgi:hypothetical protein